MIDKEMQSILERLQIIEKLYEVIRIVDPVSKTVVHYTKNSSEDLKGQCYQFMKRDENCHNCVSGKAYRDNHTYFKMEYVLDRIYMISAVPIELLGRRLVMELLMDATNCMLVVDGKTISEVYDMIDEIKGLAFKDDLTDVYNRRFIMEKLPVDLLNSALSSSPLSVIMADIDHFKKVNDTYGHLAGDFVLRSFAHTLTKCVKRESDWVARYGGEEFIIVLQGIKKDMAVEIAEKMRTTVERTVMEYEGNHISITASFGVFCWNPKEDGNAKDLINAVDKKLYEAKNTGRNKVVF